MRRGSRTPALHRCIDLPVETFAAQVWGRRAVLAHRGPDAFDDLLTLEIVDELVSRRGLRTPFLRVAKSGTTLPSSRFTRPGGVGAGVGDQVDDTALTRLFADGHTVVLQGLHRVHGPLIDFAQQLSADLGHPVQVNAYVTPASAQGFSDHYDVHDVFVLQVAGRKRWSIHDPVHRHPLRDQPWTDHRAAVEAVAATEPVLDVVLEPGDVLYLPAGFLHAAEALGETTAHLTVGVHTWNRMHLLDQALALLGEDEGLRTPLPLGLDVGDPHALLAELQHTLELARDALRHVDPDSVAAALTRQAGEAVRAEPVPPLAQTRLAQSLDDATPLRWRRHLRAQLDTAPDGPAPDGPAPGELLVRTAEGRLRLPAAARPAVQRLLDGATLTAGELGLEVARALVRSALVVSAGGGRAAGDAPR